MGGQTAEELLDSMTEDQIAQYAVDPSAEEHIVINANRFIKVPDSLKRIAVQFDHDIERVTFDCPRYWDGYDLSTMKIYVNYKRVDGVMGAYWCKDVTIDEADENIMHFDWVISREVTAKDGILMFLVCVKKDDEIGMEVNHWNSELNTEMYISKGLECTEAIVSEYPDVIGQLLDRMDYVEDLTIPDELRNTIYEIETRMATKEELLNYLPLTGGTVDGPMMADKLSNPGETGIGLDASSYSNAPFVSNADVGTNESVRAGYGFHNFGVNGIFLYLDIDGRLRAVYSDGSDKAVAWTADIEAVSAELNKSINSTITNAINPLEEAVANISDDYLSKSAGGDVTGDLTVTGTLKSGRIVSNNSTGIGVGVSSYSTAPFVSSANTGANESVRAGYSFHNLNRNGLFLYLDTDGRLKTMDNSGVGTVLSNTADLTYIKNAFTLSGDTLTINLDMLKS